MDEGLLRTIKERDFSQDIWEEKKWEEEYIPSAVEIGLAVFLGREMLLK